MLSMLTSLMALLRAPSIPHHLVTQLKSSPYRRTQRPLVMALPPGGADLQGGQDEKRNAEVARLKQMFYSYEESDQQSQEGLGLHIDLPLARWSCEPFLPHQQILLNIFQPEYTHLFEQLLATPQPWYYMHVQLPGGIESLANQDYALPTLTGPPPPPSLAPLDGTLMKIVSFTRLSDARMRIVVHGLGRATVVRGTQSLPYARGDVQLLPDAEALSAAARLGRRWLLEGGADAATAELTERQIMVAAVAEDAWWRTYENAHYELRPGTVPPAYTSFDPEEAEAAVAGAEEAVLSALRECGEEAEVAAEETAEEETRQASFDSSERVAAALSEAKWMNPLDEEEGAAAAEEAEELSTLSTLEMQVWLELDALLVSASHITADHPSPPPLRMPRRIALSATCLSPPSQRGIAIVSGDADAMPAPIQLLGLLPPPPAGGWPESFALTQVVARLEETAAKKNAYTSAFDLTFDREEEVEPYVPVDARYPARRRAQRLSYAVWPVLANYWGSLELQPALEAESTSDRLRQVLLRLRALTSQIEDKGYGDLV